MATSPKMLNLSFLSPVLPPPCTHEQRLDHQRSLLLRTPILPNCVSSGAPIQVTQTLRRCSLTVLNAHRHKGGSTQVGFTCEVSSATPPRFYFLKASSGAYWRCNRYGPGLTIGVLGSIGQPNPPPLSLLLPVIHLFFFSSRILDLATAPPC